MSVDGSKPETCPQCGFDSDAWNVRDAWTFFDALGFWWRLALTDVPSDGLNTRPAPGVWSALEYGQHSALVTAVLRVGISMILDHNEVDLPMPPAVPDAEEDDVADLDAARTLHDLEREGAALAELARRTPKDAWSNRGTVGDDTVEARAALLHAVHDGSHHQMDVSRGLASLGLGTPRQTGSITQISVSGGGVPKRAVPDATVGHRGLVGDRQASRQHHGRPFQALCLWSADVIDELAGLGHGIAPGFAGENLTITGVDWSTLRPGTRLRVGSLVAEVSYPATPCTKQSGWFLKGDYGLIDYDINPQWARWYAWVREPGEIAAGDPITLG